MAQVSERLNKSHLTTHIHIHSHMVAEHGIRDMAVMHSEDLPLNVSCEDSTVRAKTAELLRPNASVSEDEQFSLKEYVDLKKVQMRDDPIKNLADPLNKRIDDLTAQHHGLSQRVAQLESRQHVIVD